MGDDGIHPGTILQETTSYVVYKGIVLRHRTDERSSLTQWFMRIPGKLL